MKVNLTPTVAAVALGSLGASSAGALARRGSSSGGLASIVGGLAGGVVGFVVGRAISGETSSSLWRSRFPSWSSCIASKCPAWSASS